jgi:hypothetical protein
MLFACGIKYLFIIHFTHVCLLSTFHWKIFYGLWYFYILHSPVIWYTSVIPDDNCLSSSPYFLHKLSDVHLFPSLSFIPFFCTYVTKSYVEVDIELHLSDTESNVRVPYKWYKTHIHRVSHIFSPLVYILCIPPALILFLSLPFNTK